MVLGYEHCEVLCVWGSGGKMCGRTVGCITERITQDEPLPPPHRSVTKLARILRALRTTVDHGSCVAKKKQQDEEFVSVLYLVSLLVC